MIKGRRFRTPRAAAGALCVLLLLANVAAGQGPAGGPAADQPRRLSLPGRDWALDISLAGLATLADQFPPGTEQRWLTAAPADRKRFFTLLVRMSASSGGGAREARDAVLEGLKKRGGGGVSGLKAFERGDTPLLRYRLGLPASNGMAPGVIGAGAAHPLGQALTAFLAGGDLRVEVTLTANSIGERDEKVFYAVLDSARLVDASAPSTSFDFLHKGRPFYLLGRHAEAAGFYRRALELERLERKLPDALWRELVEETVAIYGATGDFKAAREALDYGLSGEPDYARFNFLMAVVHALRGDLDATVASLQKAYLKQGAQPAHLRLPDPLKHPPFARFRESEKFRAVVKALKP